VLSEGKAAGRSPGGASEIKPNQTKGPPLSQNTHNKAAEQHKNTARAYRVAAEHHGKGDHASFQKNSTTAFDHSGKSHQKSGGVSNPVANSFRVDQLCSVTLENL
jgi:hypothetical protein